MSAAAAGRLATRGSALALAQAQLAIAALEAAGAGRWEPLVIRSEGDARPDVPAAEMSGQGWFTGALERALLAGEAGCAVHSAKDLPSTLAEGLRVVAHLERADPRDALVRRPGEAGGLDALPGNATVGTSSPRRAALLAALRPDLRAVPVRGNVDTRLRRLDEGELDALLLAAAGLDRLGRGDRATERLDPAVFAPAPAQGAVALEVPENTTAGIAAADHAPTTLAVRAERALLGLLGGGCRLPLGAHARLEGDQLHLAAALGDGTGGLRRASATGPATAPDLLAERVAAALR